MIESDITPPSTMVQMAHDSTLNMSLVCELFMDARVMISVLVKQKARKAGYPSPFVERMHGTRGEQLQPNLVALLERESGAI